MPCPDHPGHHMRCIVCEADNIAAADASRYDPRDARISELESVLRLVDADIRHHLRDSYGVDPVSPALIRPAAVQAVYRALQPSSTTKE